MKHLRGEKYDETYFHECWNIDRTCCVDIPCKTTRRLLCFSFLSDTRHNLQFWLIWLPGTDSTCRNQSLQKEITSEFRQTTNRNLEFTSTQRTCQDVTLSLAHAILIYAFQTERMKTRQHLRTAEYIRTYRTFGCVLNLLQQPIHAGRHCIWSGLPQSKNQPRTVIRDWSPPVLIIAHLYV